MPVPWVAEASRTSTRPASAMIRLRTSSSVMRPGQLRPFLRSAVARSSVGRITPSSIWTRTVTASLSSGRVITVPVAESRPPRPSSVRTLLMGLNTAPGQPAGRLERSSKLTGMAASSARETISSLTWKSR